MPTIQCPLCRAANEQGPACRRCRADLGLMFAVAQARDRALAESASAARRSDWTAALASAEQAAMLRDGADARAAVAAAHLLAGDFAAAYRAYCRAAPTR
jgi:hypothetical protein